MAQPPSTPRPPKIGQQPKSQVVAKGAVVTFRVSASGDAPLSFQWYKTPSVPLVDGGRITGALSSDLTISNAQPEDSGMYFVVVTNDVNSEASEPASLQVEIPPPTYQEAYDEAVAEVEAEFPTQEQMTEVARNLLYSLAQNPALYRMSWAALSKRALDGARVWISHFDKVAPVYEVTKGRATKGKANQKLKEKQSRGN